MWWKHVLGATVCLAMGAATAWAVIVLLQPADDPLEATAFTTVEVVQGEVGASLSLNAVAEWSSSPAGANRATGVVTSVSVGAGDEVGQGSTLYTVDLRPVVIAQGQTPAFRDISEGTKGPDVAQVQEMLVATGHFSGTADGVAGPYTVRAIQACRNLSASKPPARSPQETSSSSPRSPLA